MKGIISQRHNKETLLLQMYPQLDAFDYVVADSSQFEHRRRKREKLFEKIDTQLKVTLGIKAVSKMMIVIYFGGKMMR